MAKMIGEQTSGPGTTVGVNVALTGTLKDANDITVYGMIEGEVISDKSVVIGETAQVKGPIRGKTVSIAGVVRGEIEAAEKLELMPTAKVYGGIATRDLVVQSGAVLVGKSSMLDDQGARLEEEPRSKTADSLTEKTTEDASPQGQE